MENEFSALTSEEEIVRKREQEWKEVEELVLLFQKQFEENATTTDTNIAKEAANKLLKRFSPLFKKYLSLIKTGQIDFSDPEMKLFVCSFMDDYKLQKALQRKKQSAQLRDEIYKKFNFIKVTYGENDNETIMTDLHTLFLIVAKRYKQIGKTFCGYLYNTYRYEVSRFIKKFIKNPLNISYKHVHYEDCINNNHLISFNDYEDKIYENAMGIPDISWVSGTNCSHIFSELSTLERKILVKYYLEYWNDRQISEAFGININTINQKRRSAVNTIAAALKIDKDTIKRNRRSGKKAILPMDD